MNRRRFLSLVGAAAAAASIPLVGSATPAPLQTLYCGSVPITGPKVVDWKVYYRGVVLNDAWMARVEHGA